jgi:hypothetical protein
MQSPRSPRQSSRNLHVIRLPISICRESCVRERKHPGTIRTYADRDMRSKSPRYRITIRPGHYCFRRMSFGAWGFLVWGFLQLSLIPLHELLIHSTAVVTFDWERPDRILMVHWSIRLSLPRTILTPIRTLDSTGPDSTSRCLTPSPLDNDRTNSSKVVEALSVPRLVP